MTGKNLMLLALVLGGAALSSCIDSKERGAIKQFVSSQPAMADADIISWSRPKPPSASQRQR